MRKGATILLIGNTMEQTNHIGTKQQQTSMKKPIPTQINNHEKPHP